MNNIDILETRIPAPSIAPTPGPYSHSRDVGINVNVVGGCIYFTLSTPHTANMETYPCWSEEGRNSPYSVIEFNFNQEMLHCLQ